VPRNRLHETWKSRSSKGRLCGPGRPRGGTRVPIMAPVYFPRGDACQPEQAPACAARSGEAPLVDSSLSRDGRLLLDFSTLIAKASEYVIATVANLDQIEFSDPPPDFRHVPGGPLNVTVPFALSIASMRR